MLTTSLPRPRRPAVRRGPRAVLAVLAAALVGVGAPAAAHAWTSTQPTSGPGNPLANHRWFVDWEWGMSQRQYLTYVFGDVKAARPHLRDVAREPYKYLSSAPPEQRENARLMLKLARNPQTKRFGSYTTDPYGDVKAYLDRMEEAEPGALAFLYLYRFPHRFRNEETHAGGRCGNFNADGPSGWAAHRRWMSAVADAIGGRRVVAFVEPDGLMTMKCLSRRARKARYGLFRHAISVLGRNPNTTVYIDAGHSGWKGKDPKYKARELRRAGVGRARGFFLNSTGYNWTHQEVRHGNRVSKLLGGKHFIVSTAVNGNGPYDPGRKLRYANERRCNPPGRALGPEPTVQTASPWADAYVWIGDPGRSGALCPHDGQPLGPGGGNWWPEYALGLAARAGWQ